MTHDGYPTPPGPQFFSQANVWNCVQGHKNDLGVKPGYGWATDPDGLEFCLNNMGHPPSGHWTVWAHPIYSTEMYWITYWMTAVRYPTPVLIYNQQHWVVITGFITDVDPTTSSIITLKKIEVNDPAPECPKLPTGKYQVNKHGIDQLGTYRFITSKKWQNDFFRGPVLASKIPGSKWIGKYVAVLEPPEAEGRVTLEERIVRYGRPITPDEAIDLALRSIDENDLCERERLSILCESQPFEPLLINHGYTGILWPEQEFGGYYIVPFGFEPEEIRAGIVVNAYTGEFEEAGAFASIRYLSAEEAIDRVLEAGGQALEAELIYEPSEQTESEFLPLWKVAAGPEEVLYVDQFGNVFEALTLSPAGD